MEIVSLSTDVINAWNSGNDSVFQQRCSALENRIFLDEFILSLDSNHPYIIGRAIFYDLFYSERRNYDDRRIEELVKRAFMTLTRTIFTFDNEQLPAAILLFIVLHRSEQEIINILTSCTEEKDNSRMIRRIECIKSLIWYLIQGGYKYYSFDIDIDKKKDEAVTDYLKRHAVGGFYLTPMDEVSNGQDIIKIYYKLIYDKICRDAPPFFSM